jgi:hypothetical protein
MKEREVRVVRTMPESRLDVENKETLWRPCGDLGFD